MSYRPYEKRITSRVLWGLWGILVFCCAAAPGGAASAGAGGDDPRCEDPWQGPGGAERCFTTDFRIEECTFSSRGRNPFFVLEPGFVLELAGEEGGEERALTITVLQETREVAGVTTRVVEERESAGGELVEVSRNFFARCKETNTIFYFGEEVDIYENGEIVSHAGAWLAGENGAEPGIMMPGTILLGSRYYQEIAPGVALDRAKIVAMGLEQETPYGTFTGCLAIRETTPLEPGAKGVKVYAPHVGLLVDGPLRLVDFADPAP